MEPIKKEDLEKLSHESLVEQFLRIQDLFLDAAKMLREVLGRTK